MSWIKCDPKTKAKCTFKIKCCGAYEGVYLAGSECDEFAQKVLSGPSTNADRIRAMSDGELAEYLVALVDDEFRGNVIYSKQEVDWIEWLKQPVGEGVDNGNQGDLG